MAAKNSPGPSSTWGPYLKDIEFPISKQDLLRNAQDHHAPPEVMSVLQHIPDREYGDPVDVAKGIGRSDVNETRGRGKGSP